MKNRVFFLVSLLVLSISSLYFGILGAREIMSQLANLEAGNFAFARPASSNVAQILLILDMAIYLIYLFLFKEKKRNLFWLFLGNVGIAIFSIRRFVTCVKNSSEV